MSVQPETAQSTGRDIPARSVGRPHHEPLTTTLVRTGTIALIGGAVLTRWMGGWASWPFATLLVLWPSLGGHWIELWFLDVVRPRLPKERVAQVAVRVAVWFVGGIALAFCMRGTALALDKNALTHQPTWWLGGLGFIGIELVAHAALQLRGRSSFFNGRG